MKFSVNKLIGGVLYIDKEIVCIKLDRTLLKVFEFSPEYSETLSIKLAKRTNKIWRYKEGIYFYQDEVSYFYSLKNGFDKKFNGKFFYIYGDIYKAYLLIENKDVIIFDSEKKVKVPVLQQGGPKLFLKEGFIQAEQVGSGDGSICYYDIFNDGQIVWNHKYALLAEAQKGNLHSNLLSNYNNLFFVITGNQNNGLYVLDVHSGKLLKKFDEVCYEIFQDGDFIYSTKFENVLCRINTQNLELEEWDCNSLVKSNGFDAIHDHRCAVLNDRFYFTQTIGDNKAKLGILDWDKKDLIYKYEFEPKNGGIGSIQVNESRMFVHTQDNTLHIFEID